MTLSARSRRLAARSRRLAAGPRRMAAGWTRLAPGRGVPSSLKDRLSLERGERVLTVSRDPQDGYALVATDRALYHRAGGGWSRVGWERISAVGWDSDAGHVVISALSLPRNGQSAATTPKLTSLPLRERGIVPELAEERITHTRLGRWPVPLPGGRSVIAEARRKPVTGELSWIVVPNGAGNGAGAGQPQLGAALAKLGAELGFGSQPGSNPRLPRG